MGGHNDRHHNTEFTKPVHPRLQDAGAVETLDISGVTVQMCSVTLTLTFCRSWGEGQVVRGVVSSKVKAQQQGISSVFNCNEKSKASLNIYMV